MLTYRNRTTIYRILGFSLVALWLPAAAVACLWDYDTLKQERSKFPDTLELITGKFLRHSPEFYDWRIQDRKLRLTNDPENLAFHDDLAVAYSKVGRYDDAIATMQAKEKIKPGLYETYSNLGTFYILKGDLEVGLPYIDRALAVNPDAHFGREKYQKWLVEYALTKKDEHGSISFPLHSADDFKSKNFLGFLYQKTSEHPNVESEENVKATITGVLGMMRFANYDNPLLLEALGDLLLYREGEGNANRLAARAYLQASYQMDNPAAREGYRKLAAEAMMKQMNANKLSDPSPNIEDDFKAELADAARWYESLHAKEVAWIRDGKDVEAEFDRLYTSEPQVPRVEKSERWVVSPGQVIVGILSAIVTFILGLIGAIIYFVRRRWRRTATASKS